MCPQAPLHKMQEQLQLLHLLKNFCCIESVESLGSESCHDSGSQVGKNREKTSSTLAEGKGKTNLSLCQRVTGKGWEYSQAVASALIYLRAKKQECCAGAGNNHQW